MSGGNDNIAVSPRLKPGFAEPVFESQSAFRAVLDAMSYAGRIHTIETDLDAPAPLHAATAAVALTLFDFDTAVWLDAGTAASEVPAFLKFHCGCPVTKVTRDARFGVVADAAAMPSLDDFDIGEDKYPDRSATLIVQVGSLTDGPAMTWKGPGINGSLEVRVGGLPQNFWESWALNHELYPLGLDLIFVCGHDIIGLPRSIKVEA
jgi:alpha-D-ribose 1-methylphosphonate 5-triphosphate synthase subunit PhnH